MESLCSEILQLVLYELDDPSSFSRVSSRLLALCGDPHTRANYFINRYGHDQALYYALGRPRLLTERVLEILLSSGARFSRYLCQLAIHCKFRTAGTSHPFLKSPWAKTLPLNVFARFLTLASERFGDIPTEKGADDGSIFNIFIKEARIDNENKTIKWESIRDLFEKYQFMPFCTKDPLMSQLPLALAIEPRLLPYARANGFRLDTKYRDFVFRKLFERPVTPIDDHAKDIVRNVRELCRLDACLFVSRTVASEVCMESLTNEHGYRALKMLDKSGALAFELSLLVADLLKMFHRCRGISSESFILTARKLFKDFPSQDIKIRHTMLLTACFTRQGTHENSSLVLRGLIDDMGISPVTTEDLKYLLLSPFIERPNAILSYARSHCKIPRPKLKELLTSVVQRCLTISCKGKFLHRLCESHDYLYEVIHKEIVGNWGKRLELENLREGADRRSFALCEVHIGDPIDIFVDNTVHKKEEKTNPMDVDRPPKYLLDSSDDEPSFSPVTSSYSLGHAHLETLSAMILHEESLPARARRRWYFPSTPNQNSSSRLSYPPDVVSVGKFLYDRFGPKDSVTGIMLKYAFVNNAYSVLNTYLCGSSGNGFMTNGLARTSVPITLENFEMMAQLGIAPPYQVWAEIRRGISFYRSMEDYILPTSPSFRPSAPEVKVECTNIFHSPPAQILGKRPRRGANSSFSYVEPDSDDDDLVEEEDMKYLAFKAPTPTKTQAPQPASSLQQWIQALEDLESKEKIKHRENKKSILKDAKPGTKVTVYRTEFFKMLSQHLGELKRLSWTQRLARGGNDDEQFADMEDDDDPEYTPSKRRKL